MSLVFGPHRLPRRVLVVGQGAAAQGVSMGLGRLPGIGSVQQVPSRAEAPLGFDAVVDLQTGITPSFNLAMGALSNGIACFTANPLLVAAHGRVLQAAALGQNTTFGFQAATFGLPVQGLLATQMATSIAMAWHNMPNRLLVRMGFRNENAIQAKAQLRLLQDDFSDLDGKHTAAHLIAAVAQAWPQWLQMGNVSRQSLDTLDLPDVKAARSLGLTLVQGAVATRVNGGLSAYAGPMAVGAGNPLLGALAGQSVLSVSYGPAAQSMVLSYMETSHTQTTASLGGLIADMRAWLQRTAMAAPALLREDEAWSAPEAESHRYYVRGPHSLCEELAGADYTVEEETSDATGTWSAVLTATGPQRFYPLPPAAVMLPVWGTWAPEAATGLRLVA